MFQPFNESFVQSTVEATIDRHPGESEEERLLRQGTAYHPNQWASFARKLVHAVGHWLMHTGNRLENISARDVSLTQRSSASH